VAHHHGFFKRIGHKAFSAQGIKHLERSHFGHIAQAGKVLIPVATAVVTAYAGQAAGEGFAIAATRGQQQLYRASYRDKYRGKLNRHEQSQKARAQANRTLKYSQAGLLAGGIGGAAIGGTLSASSFGSLLGQGAKYGAQYLASRRSGQVQFSADGGGADLSVDQPGIYQSGAPGAPEFSSGSFSPGSGSSGGGSGTLLAFGLIAWGLSKKAA